MAKRKKGEIIRPCWNCAIPVRFVLDGAVFAWMDDSGRHHCKGKSSAPRPRDDIMETEHCAYCAKQFERKLTERWKTKCPACWREENTLPVPAKPRYLIRGENYKPTGLCKQCVPPWEVCPIGCPDAF